MTNAISAAETAAAFSPRAGDTTPRREIAVRYALAIALVVIAHVLTASVWRTIGPATDTVFLGAVVIAALYGGYGPGLVATALAGLDLTYSFMPPYHSLALNFDDLMFVGMFTAVALLTSSLQARRRSAEASLRKAHHDLEGRVKDRTAELAASQEKLALLVNDLLVIAEREQQRIGHDLHDGLGQELTGISMLCVALSDELRGLGSPAGPHAERVADLIQQSIHHTRDLARGLCPVDLEAEGLSGALARLADRITRLPGVRCTYEHSGEPATDDVTNIHLYRVAQEAINNALRHGQAKTLVINLYAEGQRVTLSIHDDGVGFSVDDKPAGMGLRLMDYRARMVRGKLDIRRGPTGGTSVTCEIANPDGANHE